MILCNVANNLPSSPQELKEILSRIEQSIIELVAQKFLYTDQTTSDTPFCYYRGLFGQTCFILEIYNAKNSDYKSYRFHFLEVDDLNVSKAGDYWQYDQPSFRILASSAERFKVIEFNLGDKLDSNAHCFFYGYNKENIFTRNGEGFASTQVVYGELMKALQLIEVFQSNQVQVNQIQNSPVKICDSGVTRVERMFQQAKEIAIKVSHSLSSKIVLFGSLGKREVLSHYGDIDMLFIGQMFESSEKAYSEEYNNLIDLFNEFDIQDFSLEYTNGDFIAINDKFFIDEEYRKSTIQSQPDPSFFANLFKDCKVWDEEKKDFVQVDFEYFRLKYSIEESDLLSPSADQEDYSYYEYGDYYEF